MLNDFKYTLANFWPWVVCFLRAINLTRFLLPQTSFLCFLILYQLLIKPLSYTQAFAFELFYFISPVLKSLSRENKIEASLTSKKCRLAKLCKVDASSQAFHFTGETSFSSPLFFNISEISAKITKADQILV